MTEFMHAVFAFPAVLFSFALLVVIAYWVLLLLGGAELEVLDADADAGAGIGVEGGSSAGSLAWFGLGGVPVTVTLSLLIVVAWFVSLTGTVLLQGAPHRGVLGAAVLLAAVVGGWVAARLSVPPLRRLFPEVKQPARGDFVGRACVIRTGRVGPDFGQAEVTAADGATAIIQVRQHTTDVPVAGAAAGLRAGSSALIYDYDGAGEFFWVMPYDGFDPDRPAL